MKQVIAQRVGIRFSDSDFSRTIRAFLTMLPASKDYCWIVEGDMGNTLFTKEEIVRMFNASIGGIYGLTQNYFRRLASPEANEGWEAEVERIGNYLQITEDNVYLGDEVTDFIDENKGWFNGEFFIRWEYGTPIDGMKVPYVSSV